MLLANKYITFTTKDDSNNHDDDDNDKDLTISETISNPIAYTKLSDHVRKSTRDIALLKFPSLFGFLDFVIFNTISALKKFCWWITGTYPNKKNLL